MKLSTRSKGQIAQLRVELAAQNKNYVISRPSVDCYYDALIDIRDKIIRAQIKFCNRKRNKGPNLELRLDNSKSKRIYYRHTDIDVVLVFVPKIDVILKYDKKYFHRKKRIEINLTNKNSPWYFGNFVW